MEKNRITPKQKISVHTFPYRQCPQRDDVPTVMIITTYKVTKRRNTGAIRKLETWLEGVLTAQA
jgi:hypothetical protein